MGRMSGLHYMGSIKMGELWYLAFAFSFAAFFGGELIPR